MENRPWMKQFNVLVGLNLSFLVLLLASSVEIVVESMAERRGKTERALPLALLLFYYSFCNYFYFNFVPPLVQHG